MSVDHGAVTLSGEVQSYHVRRPAENAAMRVDGVTEISEELTVCSTRDGALTDAEVAREANHAIANAVNVPSSITAVVHRHEVTLAGGDGGLSEKIVVERRWVHSVGTIPLDEAALLGGAHRLPAAGQGACRDETHRT